MKFLKKIRFRYLFMNGWFWAESVLNDFSEWEAKEMIIDIDANEAFKIGARARQALFYKKF